MSDHTDRLSEPDVSVELVWNRLWPQLALRDGFWLGYLFCSNLNTVNGLVARAENYVRMRVRGIQVRSVRDPSELSGILDWLLTSRDPHVHRTWVVGILGDPPPWRPAWAQFLRRLNERRDVLTRQMPGGLVLCLPEGLLPIARDSAPDLWSYRSMVVETSRPVQVPPHRVATPSLGRPELGSIVSRALLPAVEPSEEMRTVLRSLAAAFQAGDAGVAIDEARAALVVAGTSKAAGDTALAHAWMARALRATEDLAGAVDHARHALVGEVPLGLPLTQELLEILALSPGLDIVQAVREIQLALARDVRDRDPESTGALHDLSVSLDNVAGINVRRGRLDDAFIDYAESLVLRRQIITAYGDTPQALRDLSVSLDNVAGINVRRGRLDDAFIDYAESLALARKILTAYGDTPQALRDAGRVAGEIAPRRSDAPHPAP